MAITTDVKKAMILAAGEGTRLYPLTLETPKVLLPIGGTPLIQHTLPWLKSHGIKEVAINLHHLGDKIRDSLGDGSQFGLKIHYSPEETLLGTAGGVKRMEHFFDSTFVVIYGDMFTYLDLSAMIRLHHEKKAIATIAVTEVSTPWEFGIVQIRENNKIISFIEKPPKGTQLGNMASGGIYVLQREVLDFIPSQGFYDFAYDVFPRLLEHNLPIYGYVLNPDNYMIDIGTDGKYKQANEDVKAGKVKLT
jgi:NDP-sugar pyrophosphorylase family protein